MPFVSEKQRHYLWKHEPEIARKWEREYPSEKRKKEDETRKRAYKMLRGR